MLDVCSQLKQRGAKRVFVFSTFALFCNGLDKFDKAYEDGLINKIFTTNLIYRNPELASRDWYAEVNMCKYVSYIIDTLNHDESISVLIDPVKKIHALIDKHNAELGGQLFRLCRIQGNGSDGGNGQNAVVTVIAFFKSLAAVKEVAHITLFSQNFEEIQHVRLHFSPEAVIQNVAAFLHT